MKKAELKALNEELTSRVEELQKNLESAQSMREYHQKEGQKAKNELEEMHGLLDTLPNVLPREDKVDGCSYVDIKYSPMTRLASWLGSIAHSKLTNH